MVVGGTLGVDVGTLDGVGQGIVLGFDVGTGVDVGTVRSVAVGVGVGDCVGVRPALIGETACVEPWTGIVLGALKVDAPDPAPTGVPLRSCVIILCCTSGVYVLTENVLITRDESEG